MTVERLHSILKRFPRGRIAVIGDLMLDSYHWGKVSRISPEAPVPVVNVARTTSCPGGAANAMCNIAKLKASAFAFGVVGEDTAGKTLMAELERSGIRHDGVIIDDSRTTTEKCRVIASSQQLCRLDHEETSAVDEKIRRRLVDGVIDRIRNREIDAVIFEDYRKGVLTEWMVVEIVAEANKAGVFTALDPKPGSMQPVQGLTVMKPNRGEAFALAGENDTPSSGSPDLDEGLRRVADKILELWKPEHLLISLAAQGMALYSPGNPVQVIPTRAREVFDVSGAGDTVTATFALSLVAGAEPAEAAELANLAAGIVVGKTGTAPVHYEELLAEIFAVQTPGLS